MADRTSASIFGAIFNMLAVKPDDRNINLAKKIWTLTWDYDFGHQDMGCDQALGILGLARFREQSSDEYIDFAGSNGYFDKMTKEEAIKAMYAGQKVTHRFFEEHEWITIHDDQIVYEDRSIVKQHDFWNVFRGGLAWNDDWRIWKPKEK